MLRTELALASTLLGSAMVGALACGTGGSPHTTTSSLDARAPVDAAVAFQPNPPTVYVAKVKNLLVGLPPTAAEIASVESDPTQLAGLITGWMMLPQYTTKMMRFFELAFQQTQITVADFVEESDRPTGYGSLPNVLVQNASESFARTMLQLVLNGSPLTAATTTTQFMMTPALMEYYAYLDTIQIDDTGNVTDAFAHANPGLKLTVGAAAGPIPIADSLDRTSPNFMHWYDPDVGSAYYAKYEEKSGYTSCPSQTDPIVYPAIAGLLAPTLHYLLYGTLDNRYLRSEPPECVLWPGSPKAPQLTTSDFTTWKMVTIRPPLASEATTVFYDLPTLRSARRSGLSSFGASTGRSRIVTARALASPFLQGSVGGLRPWDLPGGRHPSYAASIYCRFRTFTLWIHGYLQASRNAAERALRPIAVGRKAWMFYGSDDHASAAGNVLSLVASCKLHDLDPEPYFCDIIKVIPYWPRDRYLELAPKYWRATRARLVPMEIERELGPITIPPPLTAEQKTPTN